MQKIILLVYFSTVERYKLQLTQDFKKWAGSPVVTLCTLELSCPAGLAD